MNIAHKNESKFSETDRELEILADKELEILEKIIIMFSNGATREAIETNYPIIGGNNDDLSYFLNQIDNFNRINGDFIKPLINKNDLSPKEKMFNDIIKNPDETLILAKLIQLSPPIVDKQLIKNSHRSGLLEKIPIDFGLNPIDALTYNTYLGKLLYFLFRNKSKKYNYSQAHARIIRNYLLYKFPPDSKKLNIDDFNAKRMIEIASDVTDFLNIYSPFGENPKFKKYFGKNINILSKNKRENISNGLKIQDYFQDYTLKKLNNEILKIIKIDKDNLDSLSRSLYQEYIMSTFCNHELQTDYTKGDIIDLEYNTILMYYLDKIKDYDLLIYLIISKMKLNLIYNKSYFLEKIIPFDPEYWMGEKKFFTFKDKDELIYVIKDAIKMLRSKLYRGISRSTGIREKLGLTPRKRRARNLSKVMKNIYKSNSGLNKFNKDPV